MTQTTFQLDISRFAAKVKGRARLAVQKIAMDIDRGVVLSTPVDTGRARGGWNVGINNVNLQPGQKDKSGQSTLKENEAVITRAQAGDTVFISNNVEYIEFLEKGRSNQSPNGMVAKTLRRFPGIVREKVNETKREIP